MSEFDQLAEMPLFRGVDAPDRKALMALMERRRFAQGEVIFKRGAPGDSMYLILSGEVRIFTEDAQGNEFTLRNLDHMFGEFSMLDDQPRSASAAAATDLEVLILHRDNFVAFVCERPLVGLSMMRDLAERVRYTTAYLQRVIDATDMLARGEYDQMEIDQQAETGQDASIQKLIGQFVDMVNRVQQRENALKQGGD